MNNIKPILFYITFLSILFAFISSCSKEENDNTTSLSSTNKTKFSIQFYNFQESQGEVAGTFISNNFENIPTVIINGQELNNFRITGNLTFSRFLIPYNKLINYSVSLNGKETSGEILIPDTIPNTFTCNGQEITGQQSALIPRSDAYTVKWQKPSCDYQSIYKLTLNYFDQKEYLANTIDTESIIDSNLYYPNNIEFSITAYNGSKIEAGATPNVKGDYGNGFVTAQTYRNFSCQIGSEEGSISSKIKKTNIKEIEELNLIKQFKALIQQ